jgi:hypothetical protein
MMALAFASEIAAIPEQIQVASMRDDVVHLSACRCASLGLALITEGLVA